MSHHHTISSEQNSSATYLLEAAAGAQCSRAATAMAEEEETAQAIGKGGQVRNIDTTSTTEKEVWCACLFLQQLFHTRQTKGGKLKIWVLCSDNHILIRIWEWAKLNAHVLNM